MYVKCKIHIFKSEKFWFMLLIVQKKLFMINQEVKEI